MSNSELAEKSAPREGGLFSLEHLHGFLECSNPRAPHLLGINPIEHTAIYVLGRCKMWSCPECGIWNAARWVARIAHGVQVYMDSGETDWYLVTVTAHGDWRGTASSLKNLRGGWRRLAQRIYRLNTNSKYVRVYEHHKDGSLHLHFISTWRLPHTVDKNGKWRSKWLKDASKKSGMGFKTDYRPIENPAVAASYTAKYLAKTLEKRTWPKSLRRIQTSHNWPDLPVLPDKTGYAWEFLPSYEEILKRAAAMWRFQSLPVTSVSLGRELNTDDFGDYLEA